LIVVVGPVGTVVEADPAPVVGVVVDTFFLGEPDKAPDSCDGRADPEVLALLLRGLLSPAELLHSGLPAFALALALVIRHGRRS